MEGLSFALCWRPRHPQSRRLPRCAFGGGRLTPTQAPPRSKGSRSNGARPSDVIPHNLAAEESLLGAAMLSTTACEAAVVVPVAAYYKPAHQHIASVIIELHVAGQPVDPVTVAARLGELNLLDDAGGIRTLVTLQTTTPATSNAPRYAQIVLEHWQLRRIIHAALEVNQAAREFRTDDVVHWRAELLDIGSTGVTSTWHEFDLEPVLLGNQPPMTPTILHRDDGQALIYPGKVHAFNAESESGKSWLALAGCAEELAHGHHVTYIDFEDGAEGITERLDELGVPMGLCYGPDRLFHYVRPDDPIDLTAITRLTRIDATLVILDGVTEAMSQNGWSIKENDDVALFLASLPRVFARAGAAVIMIDHVVKNKADRGDDAIGGQHKRAGIDGASYKLEMIRPFGRNMAGAARVIVTKDRHGHIRPFCVAGKTAGELRVVSSGGHVRATVVAPSTIVDPEATFRPTVLMERISRAVEDTNRTGSQPTLNNILQTVKGDRTAKQTAITILVTEGYLTTAAGPRNSKLHASARPYREADDQATTTERDDYEEF